MVETFAISLALLVTAGTPASQDAPAARLRALKAQVKRLELGAGPLLMRALRDPDPRVRGYATAMMKRGIVKKRRHQRGCIVYTYDHVTHFPGVEDALRRVLRNDRVSYVRRTAAEALGNRLPNRKIAAWLISALRAAPPGLLQETLVSELANARHPAVVPVLAGALRSRHADLAEVAAESLAKIGTDPAMRALLARAFRSPPDRRAVILTALGEAVTARVATLDDPDRAKRLGPLGSRTVTRAGRALLAGLTARHATVRSATLKAWKDIFAQLRFGEDGLEGAALRRGRRFRARVAAPVRRHLFALVRKGAGMAKGRAIAIVAMTCPKRPPNGLFRMLMRQRPFAQRLAALKALACSLGRTTGARARGVLIRALRTDPSLALRKRALYALAKLRNGRAVAAVIAAFGHPPLRRAAGLAMVDVMHHAVNAPAVVTGLAHPRADVRDGLRGFLTRWAMNTRALRRELFAALSDDRWFLRENAVRLLARWARTRAKPRFRKLLSDPHLVVRRAARAALR